MGEIRHFPLAKLDEEFGGHDLLAGGDFIELELPEIRYAATPILPLPGAAMIYAKPGVGKTMLALHLAFCIANGKPFFRYPCHQYSVAYLDGEMPAPLLQKRMIEQMQGFGPGCAIPAVYCADLNPGVRLDLHKPKDRDTVFALPADVVILDNIASLYGAPKENEADSFRAMNDFIFRFRQSGRLLILIDHANRQGAYRGTSHKADHLDTVIQLEDQTSLVGLRLRMVFEKARTFWGRDREPLEVTYGRGFSGGPAWSMSEPAPVQDYHPGSWHE